MTTTCRRHRLLATALAVSVATVGAVTALDAVADPSSTGMVPVTTSPRITVVEQHPDQTPLVPGARREQLLTIVADQARPMVLLLDLTAGTTSTRAAQDLAPALLAQVETCSTPWLSGGAQVRCGGVRQVRSTFGPLRDVRGIEVGRLAGSADDRAFVRVVVQLPRSAGAHVQGRTTTLAPRVTAVAA